MSPRLVPFERYPGLSPLFLDFLAGLPALYPDAPTPAAVRERAASLLGRRARVGPEAFSFRGDYARSAAEELAAGRAVAVITGHQIGLFTGPLFAVVKAFDAIRVAGQLSAAGVAAVPVFFALTDDHDLEEIARTARPGRDGPEVLVLEGADRSNRRPVGPLPIPANITDIAAAFRPDADSPEGGEILERFARASAAGTSYRDAFVETLLDLVGPEPLLVLDPLSAPMRDAAGELFAEAVERESDLRRLLDERERRLVELGKPVPVQYRGRVFPFFAIEGGERRRVDDPRREAGRIARGEAIASADVLTRAVLKSFALPVAASILGAAEIAYHAQALTLFAPFELTPPVLLPRSHLVWLGPKERRAVTALNIPDERLLEAGSPNGSPPPAEAEALTGVARSLERELGALEPRVRELDPTLVGALETARRKIAYQLEQLGEKMKKAAERKDEIAANRRRLLETMLLPLGTTAERVYPPLVPLLAYGRSALAAIRAAAVGSTEGAVIVELPPESTEQAEAARAG